MSAHDFFRRNALGTRKHDIILVGFVHHKASQPHGIISDISDGQGKGWQDPAQRVVHPEQHRERKAGYLRAVQLDDQIIHGAWHRLYQHDEPCADLIEPLSLPARHSGPHGQAQQQRDTKRHTAHHHGNRRLFRNDLRNRYIHTVNIRHAEIAVQHLLVKIHQLYGQRIQQAELTQPVLDLRIVHFFIVLEVAFHRHQAQQREYDCYNNEQREHGPRQTFGRVSDHGQELLTWLFYWMADIQCPPYRLLSLRNGRTRSLMKAGGRCFGRLPCPAHPDKACFYNRIIQQPVLWRARPAMPRTGC